MEPLIATSAMKVEYYINSDIKIMEKTFSLKLYSRYRYGVVVFVPAIVLPPLVVACFIFLNPVVAGLIAILAIFILFKLVSTAPKYFARSDVTVHFDDDKMIVEYKRPILSSSRTGTRIVDLSEVCSYKFEPTLHWETFWLKLKDGKKIEFCTWNQDTDHDFDKFYSYFQKMVAIHNKNKRLDAFIERKRSIMENQLFLRIVAAVIIVFFLVTVYLVCTQGIQDPGAIVYLLMVFAPFLWIIRQVIVGLQK